MAGQRIFLLVSTWAWDNSHLEYATLTDEVYEDGGRNDFLLLGRPAGSERELALQKDLIETLKQVAMKQNACPMNREPHLARLYRVRGDRPRSQPFSSWTDQKDDQMKLEFDLEPVCRFDNFGKKHVPLMT